jgi:hypothetical protein
MDNSTSVIMSSMKVTSASPSVMNLPVHEISPVRPGDRTVKLFVPAVFRICTVRVAWPHNPELTSETVSVGTASVTRR